ncbi:MAG: thiol-disulfide oxidoreductase DCC family protein [Bacteroidota bacterium]
MSNNTSIILFDGICNLCNSSINFVIRHDKKNQFRFATLQSETGKKLLQKFNINTITTDSFILIENNKAYTKSTAALRTSKKLDKLYPLFYSFIIIPAFIRNFAYDLIARNRYKWFGKKDQCMIPTDELRSKFLELQSN